MSYLTLRNSGKFLDYVQLSWGGFSEIWELNNEIYSCIWFDTGTTYFPATIERFK